MVLYPAVVLTLIICGMGLPLSEEIVFLAAGMYGRVHGANVWALCISGIGRHSPGRYDSLLGWAQVRRERIKTAAVPLGAFRESIERTRGFLGKHGAKAVFCGRFVAGLRMPTFFMAGSMGVGYIRFLFWDMIGAMISCPTSIWLAYTFGQDAKEILEKYKPLMFAVIGLIVLVHGLSCVESSGEAGGGGAAEEGAGAQ